ncbi:hypothetical protein BH09ACT4_BH09ACT4_03270 [soil metagenome]
MILAAALLTAIGIADVARASDTRASKQQRVRSWMLAAAAVVTLAWGLGQPIWTAAIGMAIVAAWLIMTPVRRTATWAVAGLAVALTVLVVAPAVATDGPFMNWLNSAAPPMFQQLTFAHLATAVGGFVFLINTAKIVVRVVIARTDIDDATKPQPLRGGRYLVPSERILILALGLAGQFGAIGAVVGAKSIIRFPEISGSTDRGSTAEYFLIGSGLSWGLALLMLAATTVAA